MGLFSKKKPEPVNARVKVLGPGCKKCVAMEKTVTAALAELGSTEPVAHVTEFPDIVAYGVMTTPALVVDEEVVSVGKALSVADAKQILADKLG